MADEILWPLRAVSKDPTNVTTLDANGNVLTSTNTLDTRYVNVAGDTMTGPLSVSFNTAPPAEGQVSVMAEGQAAASSWTTYNANAVSGSVVRMRRSRGTAAAPASVQAGDAVGFFTAQGHNGTAFINGGNIRVNATKTPVAGDMNIQTEWLFSVGTPAGASQQMKLDAAGLGTTNVTATNVTATSTVKATQVSATSGVDCVRLDVTGAAEISGRILQKVTTGIAQIIEQTSPNAMSLATGLSVNIMPVAAKTTTGMFVTNQGFGTDSNVGIEVASLPKGPNNFSFYSNAEADNFFRGNLGINWRTPTRNLEVGGDTTLRGTCEITGNITSTGTAHAFASKSIPGMAVIGSAATAITAATPGAAGGIRWDEDFLYIRTATAWKKIPLAAV
jgi:hypothetical protein